MVQKKKKINNATYSGVQTSEATLKSWDFFSKFRKKKERHKTKKKCYWHFTAVQDNTTMKLPWHSLNLTIKWSKRGVLKVQSRVNRNVQHSNIQYSQFCTIAQSLFIFDI